MIREVGYVGGIENYSRHFDGRKAGEPPYTLIDYFPKKADGTADFLTVVDESHVALSQIGGMYAGDRSRKQTLIENGFGVPARLAQELTTDTSGYLSEKDHTQNCLAVADALELYSRSLMGQSERLRESSQALKRLDLWLFLVSL